MSTILKALRRLEQERSKGAERPLREQVVVSRARRRGPWAAWLAAGAALALGFAATWSMLAGWDAPTDEPAAAAATPAAVAAPPPAAVVAPRPAPPPVVARPAAPPSVPGAASAPPAPVAQTPLTLPPPAPTPPRVAAVPAPEPRAPARRFADEDEPVVTAPITGRAPRLVDDESASHSAHAEVPVDVVRTSWHPQAERRAAWVAIGGESPREVKEGEWVGAYEVRSIEPDGVLFADGPLLVHRPVGQR